MNGNLRHLLEKSLKVEKLSFVEADSRLNYGLIGKLIDDADRVCVLIFPETIFVERKNFSLTKKRLEMIDTIQKEYKELTFKGNKITTESLNVKEEAELK